MWESRKKAHKCKETYIRKFNEGGKAFSNIKCAFNANILINNSGILYNTEITSEYFFIPIENIRKVQVKTDQELTKAMIDNKRPIIGGLTFPKLILFFLIINYEENNLELEKTIESEMAEDAVNAILKARQHYIMENPKSILEGLDYTIRPRAYNEDSKVMDIPGQIQKLFELVEMGALSTEEFDQKKKELLLKM